MIEARRHLAAWVVDSVKYSAAVETKAPYFKVVECKVFRKNPKWLKQRS